MYTTSDHNFPEALRGLRLQTWTYPEVDYASTQLLLDHGRKVIWIIPAKNAQTSIRTWVGDVESPVFYADAMNAINELGYTVVMAIRNPTHRLVSAWRNNFPSQTLEAVANAAINHDDKTLDQHLRSQLYIWEAIGRPTVHHYIRVGEDMTADCEALPFMTGYPEHVNASHSDVADFDTLDLLPQALYRRRFANDYALWEQAPCARPART